MMSATIEKNDANTRAVFGADHPHSVTNKKALTSNEPVSALE
jgi:hypothetical protein